MTKRMIFSAACIVTIAGGFVGGILTVNHGPEMLAMSRIVWQQRIDVAQRKIELVGARSISDYITTIYLCRSSTGGCSAAPQFDGSRSHK